MLIEFSKKYYFSGIDRIWIGNLSQIKSVDHFLDIMEPQDSALIAQS